MYCLKLEVVAEGIEFMRGWSFEGIAVTCSRSTNIEAITEIKNRIIDDITTISVQRRQ